MESFSEYILSEKDLAAKMEITYYLSKKKNIFFDKSVIFKTEIIRMFLKYAKIDVDENLVLTASLLCNCQKVDNAQNLETIRGYAKKGAELLETFGFEDRFCKICKEINRYNNDDPREKESDILELVDQFGGMLLDRPERIGLKPDEAIVLLEYRNLKNKYNRYLGTFMNFVEFMDKIKIDENSKMPVFNKLVKDYNETDKLTTYMKVVSYDYEPKVDELIENKLKVMSTEKIYKNMDDPNRPLFSEQTANKIMGGLNRQI